MKSTIYTAQELIDEQAEQIRQLKAENITLRAAVRVRNSFLYILIGDIRKRFDPEGIMSDDEFKITIPGAMLKSLEDGDK